MTAALHLVVAGAIDQRTGGYLYCARMVAELRRAGVDVAVHELPGRFPDVDSAAIEAAAALARRLPPGSAPVIDGLALPAFAPDDLRRLHAVALIHHPLALETGLSQAAADAFAAIERARIDAAAHVVVTSGFTRDALRRDYGCAARRVDVALPGTARAAIVPARRARRLAVLAVGSLVPRKGHRTLLAALAGLRRRRWTLAIAGGARDEAEAARLHADRARLGRRRRVRLLGELPASALERAYRRAGAFALASRYEGYGMAFAEALRRGLPVVGTTGGAIPTVVPRSAGILVPPGDVRRLRAALSRLAREPSLRQRLAAGSRAAGRQLPDWRDAAVRFHAAVRAMLPP